MIWLLILGSSCLVVSGALMGAALRGIGEDQRIECARLSGRREGWEARGAELPELRRRLVRTVPFDWEEELRGRR